jgi:hypothetical protein
VRGCGEDEFWEGRVLKMRSRRGGEHGGGAEGGKPGRVVRRAVLSRLLVSGLFLLWRVLASPYDTSATLNPPCLGVPQGDSEHGLLFLRYRACLVVMGDRKANSVMVCWALLFVCVIFSRWRLEGMGLRWVVA